MAEPQPVFSEKEVSEIMQRAVEMQEGEQSGYARGVTREELLRISEELGVSPEVLSRAIDEQTERKTRRHWQFVRDEERVVDGEVDPDDFDLILENLKPLRNRPGATQIGKTLRAQSFAGGSIQNVEVTSRKGRTRISVRQFPFLPIFATLYPAFIGTMISSAILSTHGAAGVAMAIATGLFGGALIGMRQWLAAGNRGTAQLADRLQKSISEGLAHQPAAQVKDVQSEPLRQRLGDR